MVTKPAPRELARSLFMAAILSAMIGACLLVLSPPQPLSAQVSYLRPGAQRQSATQTLGALNATCEIDVQGFTGAEIVLNAGTLAGTLLVQSTPDGVTWDTGTAWIQGVTGQAGAKVSLVSVTNPNGRIKFGILGGASTMKVRISVAAYTSGTADCVAFAGVFIDPFGLALSANTDGVTPNFWYPTGIGGRSSESTTSTTGGAMRAFTACDAQVAINQTSATTTQLVSLVTGQSIRVCSYMISSIGAATAPTWKFVYGTGASCGTGTTEIMGVQTGSTTAGVATNWFMGSGIGELFATAVSNALCITTTTTQAQRGYVRYARF